ncbi:ribonuclease E/G [Actinomadura hibisca]|uniref:ribonuclease E/G n=1 Tax=Actinomadura hibisca TaxID=68565 RepID=UPI00082B6281|nr:ribonuclease E/G [Actinomadura hibisca]
MLENEADSATAEGTEDQTAPVVKRATRTRRRAASRPAGPPPEVEETPPAAPKAEASAQAEPAPQADDAPEPVAEKPKRATRTRAPRATRAAKAPEDVEESAAPEPAAEQPAEKAEAPARSRTRKRAATAVPEVPQAAPDDEEEAAGGVPAVAFQPPMVVFQPPQPTAAAPPVKPAKPVQEEPAETAEPAEDAADEDDDENGDRPSRRRRRRGGRGRGRTGREGGDDEGDDLDGQAEEAKEADSAADKGGRKSDKADKADKGEKADKQSEAVEDTDEDEGDDDDSAGGGSRRRRRRRRRSGTGDADNGNDDPPNTVVHVRDSRAVEDEVQSVRGSTRLEAKKQRRREGREQGRRRPPVITEAEFLARRESVERVMVVRQEGDRTQIAVLEDGILVEHYVNRNTQQSYVGNVYLGKVQNVLPSMEAAFVDIGKGRNAVLYAGEVNWDVAGLEGQPRRIESALKSGQSVLVQVTKDPLGHKGARLTSQVSLPGRYLVYVPDGSMTGISRKLPDKERSRLKQILKKIMPENAGVIVRTAAEGATEAELERDVSRLAAQWDSIQSKIKNAGAPSLLYGEPDLTVRVVRDIFNEDFAKLVVSGDEAWDTVSEYVEYVAPHLADRVERYEGDGDVLGAYRIDEQIAKALDRKVWLPSGGSLVIDRTEAMTVIDVNTGKFTGQGGNLEETVTRNNLEAAEEIVRQLRLRDIGGIIVVDFIDMVLESNRDLVLRRLVECLSRDRTKHQVAEVTSLGLVQMTRKRVGQGLLEAFSETCESCNGRGIHVHLTPVESKTDKASSGKEGGRRRKRKGEVEKAVEEKLARQESAGKDSADRDEADDTEPEPQAAVEAADAAAEAADAGAATLEAVEPVPADLNGSEPAAETKPKRAPRKSRAKKAEPKPEADADVAEAPAEDDASANGRRRRTRRAPKAEQNAEQGAGQDAGRPEPVTAE